MLTVDDALLLHMIYGYTMHISYRGGASSYKIMSAIAAQTKTKKFTYDDM